MVCSPLTTIASRPEAFHHIEADLAKAVKIRGKVAPRGTESPSRRAGFLFTYSFPSQQEVGNNPGRTITEGEVSSTNANTARANGKGPPPAAKETHRRPRRLVLLLDGEDSEVERVLAEYNGSEPRGRSIHDDVQRLAGEHRGKQVAAEWLGPLGWVRFLWCRKE